MRRVLNGAAKFHSTFYKSLLTGPDLRRNLNQVPLMFSQHQFAVSADIESVFLQVGVPDCDAITLIFAARGPHNKCCSVSLYAPYIRG